MTKGGLNAVADSVAITGAGGFVGSAIARRFVECAKSHALKFSDGSPVKRVFGILRPNGNAGRLTDIKNSDNFEIVYANLFDAVEAKKLFETIMPRAIIHAAISPAIFEEQCNETRVKLFDAPIKSMCDALATRDNCHLITTGTCAILKPSLSIDEYAAYEPHPGYVHYAKNKIHEEIALKNMTANSSVRWTHLRLFYLFGKYEADNRLVPSIVENVSAKRIMRLARGDIIRDFSDVDSVADAYRCALAAKTNTGAGQIYNIGCGSSITIEELSKIVAEAVGDPKWLKFDAIESKDSKQRAPYVCNPEKAMRELSWRPNKNLAAQLRQAALRRREYSPGTQETVS